MAEIPAIINGIDRILNELWCFLVVALDSPTMTSLLSASVSKVKENRQSVY